MKRVHAAPKLTIFAPGVSEVGGAARRTRVLIDALVAHGCRVNVICRAGTLFNFRLQRRPNVRVLEVPGFNRPRLGAALYVLVALPLGLVLASRSLAILALQLFSQSLLAGACAHLTGRPYILFSTTSGELGEAAYIKRTRLSQLRRRVLDAAACVVAQTADVAEELRALTSTRIEIVPNPVADVDAPPLTGAPRALFAGRLSDEKDLFTLMKAWRQVVSDLPAARLRVAGAGGAHRSIEHELRQLVLDDDVLTRTVELVGWIDDLEGLYAAADVFVLPSRSEGMSNALLEACMRGRVVVASRIPANVSVLGEAYPLLFEVSSADALAAALARALTDPATRDAARTRAIGAVADMKGTVVAARVLALVADAAARSRN